MPDYSDSIMCNTVSVAHLSSSSDNPDSLRSDAELINDERASITQFVALCYFCTSIPISSLKG